MAERRMFAKSIVLSDAFLDMPMSSRCLYFTLNMLADDDGFVGNPKSIVRQCGASTDDLAVLLSKRYILSFDSGVIVIKHWRMNNYLRSDRHNDTTYLEELSTLAIDDKGAYTEAIDVGIPSDNQVVTTCQPSGIPSGDTGKDRLGKDSIGKVSKGKVSTVYYPNDEKLNEVFLQYIEHRKAIKHPLKTDYAINLAMKNLEKLSNGDNDTAIEILNQSIMNGWQGLFELKNQKPKKQTTNSNDAFDYFMNMAQGDNV